MSRKALNQRLYYAKVESMFDLCAAGIDEVWWPTKKDFEELWPQLGKKEKAVTAAALRLNSIGEVHEDTGYAMTTVVTMLKEDKLVIRAIATGKMCKLPSDTARSIYLETMLKNHYSRKFTYEEVQKVIVTDRDHLREMADQLDISGDGKRKILKDIVAYGMQLKQVAEQEVDEETGVVVKPAVLALADPRMAYNAVQELNRMDHEYGQDDKATSSIEGQADRIRRLRQTMNTAANAQAEKVGAIAKKVAARELKDISDA